MPKKVIALILALICILSVIYFGTLSVLKTLYPLSYEEYVEVYASENNLSPAFVYAVIKCESGFDDEAAGNGIGRRNGCRGFQGFGFLFFCLLWHFSGKDLDQPKSCDDGNQTEDRADDLGFHVVLLLNCVQVI